MRQNVNIDVSKDQICSEVHANEMQAFYNKHHKVSSHIKVHQNTHDSVRHEVV